MVLVAPQLASDVAEDPHARPASALILWALRCVALLGLGISLFLAHSALSTGHVAGCGDGDGGAFACDIVLQSPWARWLGLPVSLGAVAVYLLMLGTTLYLDSNTMPAWRRSAWALLVLLSMAASGAALWFLGLLLFKMDAVCHYCITVHVCSLSYATLVFLRQPLPWKPTLGFASAGLWGVVLLVGGQWLFPPQLPFHWAQAIPIRPAKKEPVFLVRHLTTWRNPAPPKSKSKPRRLRYGHGVIQIDTDARPILGSPDAPTVLVEMFDYTCHYCREMHRHLEAVRETYGDQVAVIVVPVPYNHKCNRWIRKTPAAHQEGCEIARLALAVWHVAPQKFPEYHRWLLETPKSRTTAEARQYAVTLIGQEALQQATQDWQRVIRRELKINADLNELVSRKLAQTKFPGAGVIPKILVGNKVISAAQVHSSQDLQQLLSKELRH